MSSSSAFSLLSLFGFGTVVIVHGPFQGLVSPDDVVTEGWEGVGSRSWVEFGRGFVKSSFVSFTHSLVDLSIASLLDHLERWEIGV